MGYTNIGEAKQIADFARLFFNKNVLEAGFGYTTIELARVIENFTVMDIEDKEVPKGARFIKGDATKADLSGLEGIIAIGLGTELANDFAKNGASYRVQKAIFSPPLTKPKELGYEQIGQTMIGEKIVQAYKLIQ